MQTGHPNSHKYQLGKALSTHPMIGDSDGTKVQGAFPYYLIVVHEAADDECAHARLITDINHLRYRYTSLLMSSETTRALSKTESWVAAWLEFFLRSTLGLSSMSEMKTENSWLGNEWNSWERCSSGRVAKTSWKMNKNSDNAELRWKWSFRIGGFG
jgi:hypothetical protein